MRGHLNLILALTALAVATDAGAGGWVALDTGIGLTNAALHADAEARK